MLSLVPAFGSGRVLDLACLIPFGGKFYQSANLTRIVRRDGVEHVVSASKGVQRLRVLVVRRQNAALVAFEGSRFKKGEEEVVKKIGVE